MEREETVQSQPALRGRPRSESARRAVLGATRELLADGGYPSATIEAIAARSGVAKTTIYRWWPNRAALVVEVLLEIANVAVPPPSGKDALKALRTELGRVAKATDELPGRLMAALTSEAESDLDIREALRKGLFTPRRQATASVIAQAQEQGTIRKDVAALLATDLLFGPLFYRTIVRHEPATQQYVRELWDLAMAGLAPRPEGAQARRRGKAGPRPKRRES